MPILREPKTGESYSDYEKEAVKVSEALAEEQEKVEEKYSPKVKRSSTYTGRASPFDFKQKAITKSWNAFETKAESGLSQLAEKEKDEALKTMPTIPNPSEKITVDEYKEQSSVIGDWLGKYGNLSERIGKKDYANKAYEYIKEKDRELYKEALSKKPTLQSSGNDVNTFVNKLSTWTEKYEPVLTSSEDRYNTEKAKLDKDNEIINTEATKIFPELIKSMPTYLGKSTDNYITDMNTWISNNQGVLTADSTKGVAQKIIEGTLSTDDLDSEELKDYNDLINVSTGFSSGHDLYLTPDDSIIKGNLIGVKKMYIKGWGLVEHSLPVGDYQTLDIDNMKINNYNNTLTGKYYDRTMGDYDVEIPKFVKTVLPSTKIGDGVLSPKAKALFLQNKSTAFGKGVLTEADKARAKFRSDKLDAKYKKLELQNLVKNIQKYNTAYNKKNKGNSYVGMNISANLKKILK